MPRYIPNTTKDVEYMLTSIGCKSVEELFSDIPEEITLKRSLELPMAMDEMILLSHMKNIAAKNANCDNNPCFLGAGVYDHYIPSIIGSLVSRQEFYTAYTPYQPEISQGTLEAIFEYQTMICELTGMDVANASMYDGASSLAEAVLMACKTTSRNHVIVAKTVNPEARKVIDTYTRFNGIQIHEVGYSDGKIDFSSVEQLISDSTAAIVVQSPNFFGIIEEVDIVASVAHSKGALCIVSADPISLGLLKSPGELGADIVVGEGQALGNSLSFGGPYLGFFSAKESLLRRMPGRIAGMTSDATGKRGFVLTMQTREQHIRREKATSNICSNQALNALTAAMYMTTLGPAGLKKVAELCVAKAHYAKEQLEKTGKFSACFSAPFFKEFAIKAVSPISSINEKLMENSIIGGLDLGIDYPELSSCWLVAVTEARSKEQIDDFVLKAGEV